MRVWTTHSRTYTASRQGGAGRKEVAAKGGRPVQWYLVLGRIDYTHKQVRHGHWVRGLLIVIVGSSTSFSLGPLKLNSRLGAILGYAPRGIVGPVWHTPGRKLTPWVFDAMAVPWCEALGETGGNWPNAPLLEFVPFTPLPLSPQTTYAQRGW